MKAFDYLRNCDSTNSPRTEIHDTSLVALTTCGTLHVVIVEAVIALTKARSCVVRICRPLPKSLYGTVSLDSFDAGSFTERPGQNDLCSGSCSNSVAH